MAHVFAILKRIMTYHGTEPIFLPFEATKHELTAALERILEAIPEHPLAKTYQVTVSSHRPKPVATSQTDHHAVASWHQGGGYDVIALGNTDDITRYADVTSTEREQAVLTVRKYPDASVYAVATVHTSHETPGLNLSKLKPLRFLGLVIA